MHCNIYVHCVLRCKPIELPRFTLSEIQLLVLDPPNNVNVLHRQSPCCISSLFFKNSPSNILGADYIILTKCRLCLVGGGQQYHNAIKGTVHSCKTINSIHLGKGIICIA